MKIIDKIMKFAGYEKSSRMVELAQAIANKIFIPTYGASTPENYSKNVTAYANEVWIYACVYLISNTIAGLPWRLFKWKIKKGKQEKEVVTNNDFETLIEKPNRDAQVSTFYNLMEWTCANLELLGNAYWLKDELYGTPKRPRGLMNLMTAQMRVIPGESAGMVSGYKFRAGSGKDIEYTPEEILHFQYMSPDNYFYGASSLNPALYSIDVIKEAQKTNLNMFKNGAKIDAYLESEQELSERVFERVKKQFNQRYAGADNAHTTPILEKGLKYHLIAGNMQDLEYINGIKLSREDICAVHGVPPVLVGILDNSSYSNYETALKVFFFFNIIPKLQRINAYITSLAQLYDKNMYFEFDVSNEEALKENETQKAQTAQIYFNMGIPFNIVNQRLNLGFPEIEGGDIGYLPFSLQPVDMVAENSITPESPEVQSNEDEEEEEGKMKKLKSIIYTKEIKKELWKQFDRLAAMIERRYMQIISTYFLGLELGILRRMNSPKSIDKDIRVETFIFDEDEEIERWLKQSRRVHEYAMKANGDRELSNLGMGIAFDLQNPRVQEYLAKYGLEKSKEVIGSAREAVKNTLIEGINAGEGIPELTKRVKETFQPYTDAGYKAERIARTEVIGTCNRGALEAYRQVGAEKKAWLATHDDRVRDEHLQAGNEYDEKHAIGLDEMFIVGGDSMLAPGGGSDPAQVVNCRCSIIAVVDEGGGE